MTEAGYPATRKPADLMNDQDLDRVLEDHFHAPTPDYNKAIEAIQAAMNELDGVRKDIEAAATAVEGTTHGYQLHNAANEIQEESDFLDHLMGRLRRMNDEQHVQ